MVMMMMMMMMMMMTIMVMMLMMMTMMMVARYKQLIAQAVMYGQWSDCRKISCFVEALISRPAAMP